LQLLTLDPDRVATVVLANSAGFGPEVHLILRIVATPVIGDLVTRSTTRASARILERILYVDRSFATNERIDHALEIAKQPGTGAVLYETSRSLGTLRGVRSSWRNELMSAVSEHPRPTLIVWGDRDRILPVKQMKTAQRLLPHARVHLFKDAGHMPQLERAAQFGELTLDFLGTQAVA
jgi:pimeloyl-ACP methyl ester carboxylesterase